MSQIVRFEVDGGPVMFEARGDLDSMAATEARGDLDDKTAASTLPEKVVTETDKALDSVFGIVGRIATSFSAAIENAPVTSSEVEFGLQITGAGDFYVVKGSATASLTIRLTVDPHAGPVPQDSNPKQAQHAPARHR
jgi:hypothetical protein